MATRAETAWGAAAIVDELVLPQAAGEKRFAAVVQLLADGDGSRYVRFAYTTDGVARRGPVTFREEDLARLGTELGGHPELAGALGPALPSGVQAAKGGRKGRR